MIILLDKIFYNVETIFTFTRVERNYEIGLIYVKIGEIKKGFLAKRAYNKHFLL